MMARLVDIVHFSEVHALPVVTIEDFVSYRQRALQHIG